MEQPAVKKTLRNEKKELLHKLNESNLFNEKQLKRFKNMTLKDLKIALSKSDKSLFDYKTTQDLIDEKREKMQKEIDEMSEVSEGNPLFNDYKSIASCEEAPKPQVTQATTQAPPQATSQLPPPQDNEVKEEEVSQNDLLYHYKMKVLKYQFNNKSIEEQCEFLFHILSEQYDLTDYIEEDD